MREIIFRGKRVDNGEFVFGDHILGVGPKYGKVFILPRTHIMPKGCNSLDGWEVDPKTVGQWTGAVDKNEVRIFEGDVLKIQLPMGGFWGNVKTEKIGTVKYEPEHGSFIVKWQYSKNQHHVILNCDIAIDAEIIGNSHDNPELLK